MGINYENELKSAEKQCKELSSTFDKNIKNKDASNENLKNELKESETTIGSLKINLEKINEKFQTKNKETQSLKEEIVRLKEDEINLQNRLEITIKDKDEAQNNYTEELQEHANALKDIEQKNAKLMVLKEELLEKDNTINNYKLQIVKN